MQAESVPEFLRGFPSQVDKSVVDLSPTQMRWRPREDEWSVLEVCCHVRDAFEIEGMRIRALLAEPGVTLPAFDGIAYVKHRLYNYDDPARVLAALHANCEELAQLISQLAPHDWERAGVHEEAGPVTVGSRALWLIEHGRDHLQQIIAVRDAIRRS
jgi:hypothetical protein